MQAESHGLDFSVSVAEGPGGGAVITVLGELDAATAPRLRDAYERAIDLGDSIMLDLRGCSFMDSTGVAAIVGIAWRLNHQGGSLKLRGVRPRVLQILELTGVTQHRSVEIEPARD